MLIARRNLMAGKPLPYLRRVAYLESHGTEWIDTGVMPYDGLCVDIGFSVVENSNVEYFIFGGYTAWMAEYSGIGIRANLNTIHPEYWNNGGSKEIEIQVGRRFDFSMTYDNKLITCFDGKDVISEFTMNWREESGAGDICVFARSAGEVIRDCANLKVYYFTLKKGDVLIDLTPVLDLSGRPAMYDEVSGQFFYNQGTGEFTWGELGE